MSETESGQLNEWIRQTAIDSNKGGRIRHKPNWIIVSYSIFVAWCHVYGNCSPSFDDDHWPNILSSTRTLSDHELRLLHRWVHFLIDAERLSDEIHLDRLTFSSWMRLLTSWRCCVSATSVWDRHFESPRLFVRRLMSSLRSVNEGGGGRSLVLHFLCRRLPTRLYLPTNRHLVALLLFFYPWLSFTLLLCCTYTRGNTSVPSCRKTSSIW